MLTQCPLCDYKIDGTNIANGSRVLTHLAKVHLRQRRVFDNGVISGHETKYSCPCGNVYLDSYALVSHLLRIGNANFKKHFMGSILGATTDWRERIHE